MEDILQIVLDKKSHRLVNYGDIQIGEDGFNMGLTIAGTKDSCKIKIFNYSKEPVESFSLAYHPNTQTWWIVSSDDVDKYYHEGSYLYIHTLQLVGAIELLNARDLTDSGFYGNQYTIGGFIQRLFALSNFEFPITINGNNNINLDEKVDYLKSFENYLLGSAIREFLDGYNCSGKLIFNTENNVITSAILNIIPRTGDETKETLSMDAFNEVREHQEMKRQNFATSVISNAENVVSTKAKTYPASGATRLKTNESYALDIGGVNSSGTIVKGNAKILLPSDAYKVNWIKMFIPITFKIIIADETELEVNWNSFNGDDLINRINYEIDNCTYSQTVKNQAKQVVANNRQTIIDRASKMRTVTFYGGAQIKQYLGSGTIPTANIIPPTNNHDFYIPRFKNQTGSDANNVVLVDEETYNALHNTRDGIMWKRGSNEITSFGGIGYRRDGTLQTSSYLTSFLQTDLREDDLWVLSQVELPIGSAWTFGILGGHVSWDAQGRPTYSMDTIVNYHKVLFQVNYIPMSDIKIKQDNQQESRDIKLYNQNGKLTDTNAFSRMLLSHAKEVSTKTITKFGVYNYPSDILPQIGQKVYDKETDEYYVIENISYDIYANEGGYFVSGTFELAPNIAVKSLMVNPNTNIRDYGIPQTNNVKRKQIYRDFYEIDTIKSSDDSTWYLPISSVVNFNTTINEPKEHTAIIKITFDDDSNYYYQLDTTTYVMKKSVYEVVDFKDNNIIGYDCQTRVETFDISKVFDFDHWQDINTPISYVDDNGKFRDIEIIMATQTTLQTSYNEYLTSKGYDPNQYEIANRPVYISNEIYNTVENNMVTEEDFKINGTNYGKDPIEVPVFEYSCQIDDGDNVLVGENILDIRESDQSYAYGFAIVDKGTTTLLNATNNAESLIISNNVTEINNYAKVSFVYKDYVESISSFRLDNNVIVTNWYNLPANAINVGTYGLSSIQYRISPTPQWRFIGMNIEYDSTNNRVRFVSDTITLPSGVFTIEFRGAISYKYNFANDFNISIKLYRTSQFDVSNGSETLGTLHTEYNLSNFENKDLVILRYRFNQDLQTYNVEPTFVIKNLTEDNIVKTLLNTFDYIKLYVNYYKS